MALKELIITSCHSMSSWEVKQHIVNQPLESVGIVLKILIQYVMYMTKYMYNMKSTKVQTLGVI